MWPMQKLKMMLRWNYFHKNIWVNQQLHWWNLLEHFFHVWEFENTGIKIEPDVHDTFHDRLEEILMDLFT